MDCPHFVCSCQHFKLYHISQFNQNSDNLSNIIKEINDIQFKSNTIVADFYSQDQFKYYTFCFESTILIIDSPNLRHFEIYFDKILSKTDQNNSTKSSDDLPLFFVSKQCERELFSDIFNLFNGLKINYQMSNEKNFTIFNQEIQSFQKSDHFQLKKGNSDLWNLINKSLFGYLIKDSYLLSKKLPNELNTTNLKYRFGI